MRCLFLPVGLFSTVVYIPNGGGDLLPSRKSDKNVKMHPLALVASMAEALERNHVLIATKWCQNHFGKSIVIGFLSYK